jgi:hypothetical protein
VLFLLHRAGLPDPLSLTTAALFVITIRFTAILRGWQLPGRTDSDRLVKKLLLDLGRFEEYQYHGDYDNRQDNSPQIRLGTEVLTIKPASHVCNEKIHSHSLSPPFKC